MTPVGAIRVRAGREKKLRAHYPWVQRGEVAKIEGEPPNGAVVRVLDHQGAFVGTGVWNEASRFQVRVFSLADEPLDEAFFARRVREALDRRLGLEGTNSKRVLFAEADGVPGLIVDQFGPHLVVQTRSLGADKLRGAWLPALAAELKPHSIYERSEMEGRKEEGLAPFVCDHLGEIPEQIEVSEDGLELIGLPRTGLKTGYYLDQRATRRRLRSQVQPGERVLDAFCYTGSCSLAAAQSGADVLGLDILPLAIETASEAARQNSLQASFEQANAFEFLEASEDKWDWILLDPPAIAKTASKRDSLKWGIWKLVFHAIPRLRPGGRLVVCNCSYQLSLSETLETCRLAAGDRGAKLLLEHVGIQDVDHPAPLNFPEALYLKCLWLRVA